MNHEWTAGSARILLQRRGDTVIHGVMEGYLPASAGQWFADTLVALLDGGPTQSLLLDARQLTGYGAEFRRTATHAVQDHREQISAIHALVQSRIVFMGIAVTNMFLDGLITVHRHLESFEAQLDAAQQVAS